MKATPVASPSRAEAMGYDAAINKPNTTNCHFSCFATKELMKAWERGNKRGKAELQSRKNEQ
jgi:hypothetical protein